MLIIVEGVDRVGKTTLCKKLQEECGFLIYNDPRFLDLKTADPDTSMKVMLDKMYSILYAIQKLGADKNIVVDRFHITEMAYGIADRKSKALEEIKYFIKFDEMLRAMDAHLIYVKPINIRESIQKHGSDLTVHNNLFEKAYAASTTNKIRTRYDEILLMKGQWFLDKLVGSENNENSSL